MYFRYYTQTFFVSRLIINQINKVQWVDFKLENVLVSLHSLKTMGLGSIIFKEWRVTWTFSYTESYIRPWYNSSNFAGPSKGTLHTQLVIMLKHSGFFYIKNKCGHRNVLSKRQVWMSIFHITNLKKKIQNFF